MSGRHWRQALAALAVVAVVFSSGCWDFRQLNERAFVLMIGIDRGPNGKGYHVTTQKIIGQYLTGAQAGTGGGGQQRRPWIIRQADGETVMKAIDQIRMGIHRDLEFAHLKVIVISDEVVKEEDLIDFDYFSRALKIPETAFIAVAHGRAADVVSAPNQAEDLPALYVYHGYTGRYARTEAIVGFPVWYVLTRVATMFLRDAAASGLGLDNGEVNFAGTAVWSGSRFAGWLSPFETRLLSFYLHMKEVDDYLIAPKRETMRNSQGSSRYWADWDPDGTVVLHVKMSLSGDLLTTAQPVITLEDEDKLEATLSQQAKENTENFLRHLQSINSDPLGFGEKLREVDNSAPEVQSFAAWHEAYQKARLDVQSTVTFSNRGYIR